MFTLDMLLNWVCGFPGKTEKLIYYTALLHIFCTYSCGVFSVLHGFLVLESRSREPVSGSF